MGRVVVIETPATYSMSSSHRSVLCCVVLHKRLEMQWTKHKLVHCTALHCTACTASPLLSSPPASQRVCQPRRRSGASVWRYGRSVHIPRRRMEPRTLLLHLQFKPDRKGASLEHILQTITVVTPVILPLCCPAPPVAARVEAVTTEPTKNGRGPSFRSTPARNRH